jgi:hypothetical protein
MQAPSGALGAALGAPGLANLRALTLDSDARSFWEDPAAMLEGAIALLLRGLKAAAIGAITLVQSAVDAIFDLLKEMIAAVFAICEAHLAIPYLTTFYEKVVLRDNGEQLTLLNLVALAAAIPATVTYKLASGSDGPLFSDDDLAALQQPDWEGYTSRVQTWLARTTGAPQVDAARTQAAMLSRDSVSVSTFQKAAWGLTAGYAVSTGLWGIACVLEDTPGRYSATPRWLSGLKLGAQVIALATGAPFWTMSSTTPTPTIAINSLIFCGAVLALRSNYDAVWDEVYAKTGDPLLTGVYGILQYLGYAAMTIISAATSQPVRDRVVLTLLTAAIGDGEATEWWPQLLKLAAEGDAEPATKVTMLAMVPLLDGAAYALVTVGTFASLFYNMAEVCTGLTPSL